MRTIDEISSDIDRLIKYYAIYLFNASPLKQWHERLEEAKKNEDIVEVQEALIAEITELYEKATGRTG